MRGNMVEQCEKMIRSLVAKYHHIDGYDYEDLLQEGRIIVLNYIEKNEVNEENFDDHNIMIWMAVKRGLGHLFTKSQAKKRINLSMAPSLDKDIGDTDGTTLISFITAKEDISETTIRETMEKLKRMALDTKDKKIARGVIYCLVELMGLSQEEIPKKINYPVFCKYDLRYFLWVFFNNSPYRALRYAYPNLSPNDMKMRPIRFWFRMGRKKATVLLREILEESGYEEDLYPKLITESFLEESGLSYPHQIFYNSSPYAFLDATFPGKFHPWEMRQTSKEFMTEEYAKRVIKWAVEEKMGIPLSEMDQCEVWRLKISKKITRDALCTYGLRGYVNHYGNCSEKLLRLTYPDKFQEWDFPRRGKWSGEDGRILAGKATRWVIEEYAGLSPDSLYIDFGSFLLRMVFMG